ncbi:cytochrome b561 isoform X1 [Polypterus senegalus]|nr:cytochrome b561 isoform X1 [Polypterus senegalus]
MEAAHLRSCSPKMAESPSDTHSISSLPWYIAGSQIVGLTVVVITGVWMGHYRGGYEWTNPALEFNIHPLCMVIGMVYLYGDAILVYRVFRNEKKRTTKILHGVIHVIALVISIVGFTAVFDSHSKSGITHMYSLHSWCGMMTFIIFCVQWVMGLTFFLFPGAAFSLRSWYIPLHIFFGLGLFALSIGTCLLGVTEKVMFSISSEYSKLSSEGVLANVLGLLLVIFGVTVGYVTTREEWKRPPNPEEQALSMDFKTFTEGEDLGSP